MRKGKTKTVNIYYYVSSNNKDGVKNILKNAGYRYCPKNPSQASLMLADHVQKNGESALKEIADIHPDKELIVKTVVEKAKAGTLKNADGYEKYESILAADASVEKKGLSDKTVTTLILAGAGVFVIAMATIIATSKS